MDQFLQFTVSAITLACTVSLISTGWVLIYQVSHVLNLAQGNFLVVGGLLFVTATTEMHLPVVVALLLTIGVVGCLGVAVDLIVLRPAKEVTGLAPIFITLGLSYVLAEIARMIWGADPLTTRHFFTDTPLELGGVRIQVQSLLLWGVTAVAYVGLWLLFGRTLLGKAMMACAQSPIGASLIGISPARMRTLAFGIAAGLGAIAGVLIIPLSPISWADGLHIGLQGLVAALLGHWTYRGAVAGAVLLAAAETYSAAYLDSSWKDAVWLALLIGTLLVSAVGTPRWVRLRKYQHPERRLLSSPDRRPLTPARREGSRP